MRLIKRFEYNLVPDILGHAVLFEPITHLEFSAVAVKIYENLAGTKALPATANTLNNRNNLKMLPLKEKL